MSSGRISSDTVLAACDDVGTPHEPVTASEIAEELGCTRRSAYNKLDELADRGDVRTKKIGARARVWWLPADRDSSADRASASGHERATDVLETASLADEREHRLSRLIDDLPNVVYRCQNERGWPMEFVSEACRDLTGYDPDSLERGDILWGEDVVVEADREDVWEEIQTAVTDREPFSLTYRIETADGERRWVRSYGRGIFDDDGDLVVLEGTISDITERKRLEADLAESEHRYRTLVENFPNGAVSLVNRNLHYRTVGGNPLESTVEELEGSPIREILPAELADVLVPRYEAAFEGESSEFEVEHEGLLYKLRIVPVRDDDGDIFAALGMSQDITEHKENQRELQNSERRYRTLIENFPNGSVGLFDEDLRYTAIGGQLVDTLDLSPEERIGRRISDLHPDDLLAEVEPYFRAALEGEANAFEVEYRGRHLFAQTVPVRNADDEVDAGMLVVQDVTERREAQRELRESEAKFRMLAENLDEIVWMATEDAGEFIYLNPAFEEVWGLNREELYDDPLAFLEAVHPDDRERVWEEFAALPESDFDEEYRIVRPDGENRWVHARGTEVHGEDGETSRIVGVGEDITDRKERERELERALDLLDKTERIADVGGWEIDVGTRDVFWTDHVFDLLEVSDDEEPSLNEALDMYHEDDHSIVEDAVESALDTGDPFDVEVRIRTDSGEMRWLRLQGVPETVDDDVVAFRGAAQNITEQVERERELEETVEQLEESNDRLESFASMLAHELRNPVAIGQIYSQRLPTETDSEVVDYVTEAFDRIEAMIDVMLVLTRGREAVGNRTPVRLADVGRSAWDHVDAPDATLAVDIDDTIEVDETYVRHLFQNLFENAVEHGGRDVTITVGELPTGFYVADDGPGIPVGDRAAVFEPGFTTAAEQGGTGLGLAFVERLAEVYEWECGVTESTAGGARFEFTNVNRD